MYFNPACAGHIAEEILLLEIGIDDLLHRDKFAPLAEHLRQEETGGIHRGDVHVQLAIIPLGTVGKHFLMGLEKIQP